MRHIYLDSIEEDFEDSTPFPVFSVYQDEIDDGDFSEDDLPEELPVLPLRGLMLFPTVITPVVAGRAKSKRLLEEVEKQGSYFVCTAQSKPNEEEPGFDDLHPTGVLCELIRLLEMPDDSLTAIVQPIRRFYIESLTTDTPYLKCKGSTSPEHVPNMAEDKEFAVLVQTIKEMTIKIISMVVENPPREMLASIKKNKNAVNTINYAASGMSLEISVKQALLEMNDLKQRGYRVLFLMRQELQLLEIKAHISSKTRREMDKQQKEYFLQQQIRTIQEELGGNGSDVEIADLERKAKGLKWSDDVEETFRKELSKLERLHPQSPDYSVQMQYLQTVVELPWGKYSKDNFDLARAERILNRDHFGLETVKERILEHLAVLKLKNDMKSPIICLYGPPGVGKTSLGKSIAESLGRKYVRISLGGLQDEAEIRGHRRTYIGSMPGRIIQSLKRAGTSNPVFVLDEIDKIDSNFKGDPSSALLEVLDPEQNEAFHDNYLDIDYDLSKVLFIATANTLSTISAPLLDRMELIPISGYIIEEKKEIAKRHLIPKELEAHGLKKGSLRFPPTTLEFLIDGYTRESGVRQLQKKIAAVIRKHARVYVTDPDSVKTSVTRTKVKELLKEPPYDRDLWQDFGLPGIVIGLAWTSVGGEILFIESSIHPGKGSELTLTGNLGDVMKESAVIALDYIKARAQELGIDKELLEKNDIHIHVPEGAIPKDGPSAGITMLTSLVSVLTGRHVKPRLAMTGEVTLSGRVLPVGGVKEKILAAKRSGVTQIIMSKQNKKDIEEIEPTYIKGLTFHYIQYAQELFDLALEPAAPEKKTSTKTQNNHKKVACSPKQI